MSNTECTAQYCNNNHEASIFPALRKSFGYTFLFGALLKFMENCLVFLIPQVLR